jgi:hypothetical protein
MRTLPFSEVRVSFGCAGLIHPLFLEIGVDFELALVA